MKKLSLPSAVTVGIVLFLASSCMKDELAETAIPPGFKVVEYSVSPEMTKTSISDDGVQVSWTEGDEIRIFYEGGSTTATARSSGPSTTFRAVVPHNATCWGIYPSDVATFQNGTFTVTIPAEQEGAFADGHFAVALLDEKKTSIFHNITSFIKVAVNDAEYTKVVVKAVGGEKIAGMLSLTMDGTPVIGELSGGSDEITLSVDGRGVYYIAIAPDTEFTKGILATYYKGDTAAGSYFLNGNFKIPRSTVAKAGVLEERIGKYYVSPTGANAKTGENEENAMDPAMLYALLNATDADKFSAQAAALDSATVYLAAGEYDFGEILTMSYGGESVNITFQGAEDATSIITGGGTHRLLVVGSGVKASFDNVTFSNSRSYISTQAGILFEEGSELRCTNCKIIDNVNQDADIDTLYHSQAGIKAYGKAFLDSCEFARNKASYGASLTLNGDATVRNCNFHHNEGIHGPGNSLYVDANCTVTVENCQFLNNRTSEMDGGAVAISAGTLNMTGCTLDDNSNDGRWGGALYSWNNAKVKLTNCTMRKNSAGYGGAIFTQDNSELEILGGTFSSNFARGGGFLDQGGNSKVTIKQGATIQSNYATGGHGGAILMASENGSLTCENVSFKENHNESSLAGGVAFGGAIGTTGKGMTTIKNCTFYGNYSFSFGGTAINMQGSGDGIISDCTFESNFSESSGIPANNANGRYAGAAMRLDNTGSVSVENCTFTGNSLAHAPADYNHAYGGAVYINAGGNFRFNGCKFIGNKAVRGGAFCAWATGAKIYMNGCSFDGNNISFRYGTTIHIEKAQEFCMNNCSINDNTWTTEGINGWQAAWVNLADIKDLCLSNCSFIGSPKYGDTPQISNQDNAIVRFSDIRAGKHYFVNNIIVTETAEGKNKSFANYNTSDNFAYFTRRSDNSANGAGGSYTMIENPGSNGFSKDSFGDLQWNSTYMCWTWNGTMTGGNNMNLADSETAVGYISEIPAFKAWLEEIGALYKDQMGNPRATSGTWWPGAASSSTPSASPASVCF